MSVWFEAPASIEAFALSALFGYALGSIPFGLLFAGIAGLGDLRETGSGNIGATNALRAGGKILGAATLLADALKSALPVAFASWAWGSEAGILAGGFSLIGHAYPVWLRFRGGKGVASYLGVAIAAAPSGAVAFAAAWLALAAWLRYSSLASLGATLAAPVAILATGGRSETVIAFAAMSAIVWVRHRRNIQRLLSRTETRIGEKDAKAETETK